MSRIWRWPNGGLWVWVVIGRGAVDRCEGFAFAEVFRCGFVCVCVLLGGLIGNGGLGYGFLPFCLSSFFSLIWVL